MIKDVGKWKKFFIFTISIIILDQLTKSIIKYTILQNTKVSIIPNILYIAHTYNTGFAFGFGSKFNVLILILTSLITITAITFYKKLENNYQIPFSLIIAGAIGNIIDRVLYYPSGVLDFINIPFFSTFNIADCAITMGGIWIAVLLIIEEIKSRNKILNTKLK